MYNLNTIEGAIAYDNANSQWFDSCISDYVAAGGDLNDIDVYTFSAWFDLDQEIESGTISEQDREEALARARAAFDERVEHARRATFIKKLEESAHGLEIPYAGIYTVYVSEDEEEGGYWIRYCDGMMPPHKTEHVASAEEAARTLAEVVDLNDAREIEPEE